VALGIGSSVVEVVSVLEAVPLPPLFICIGMSYGDLYLISLLLVMMYILLNFCVILPAVLGWRSS